MLLAQETTVQDATPRNGCTIHVETTEQDVTTTKSWHHVETITVSTTHLQSAEYP